MSRAAAAFRGRLRDLERKQIYFRTMTSFRIQVHNVLGGSLEKHCGAPKPLAGDAASFIPASAELFIYVEVNPQKC